jgi:3-isopropylmalate/(R)-2-methylmalate dehydratase large subunit
MGYLTIFSGEVEATSSISTPPSEDAIAEVHPKVRFYVAPASWELYKEALEKGLLGKLLDSGVMIGNPSCGLCTGYQGVLAAGEKCIAAVPRNFKGRMGSNDAEIYLASPATVAVSALAGKIVDPTSFLED